MSVLQENIQPPEWVVALENKQKRFHKLAHDVGAGAPCLNCLDACVGLDLHFWRKLCRNCKCKKESHDIKDENTCEQFEILFGESSLKNNEQMKQFSLKLENEIIKKKLSKYMLENQKGNDFVFDWIPEDVSPNIASEYMQQLPVEKLPIKGSEGAVFRRQQLQKQIPLHDFSINKCHDLSSEEALALTNYLQNLKENVVGKGNITKIRLVPDQLRERKENICSNQSETAVNNEYKTPFVKNLNVTPKPFKPFTDKKYDGSTENALSPLSDLLHPSMGLKLPSAFIKSAAGKSTYSVDMNPEDSFKHNTEQNTPTLKNNNYKADLNNGHRNLDLDVNRPNYNENSFDKNNGAYDQINIKSFDNKNSPFDKSEMRPSHPNKQLLPHETCFTNSENNDIDTTPNVKPSTLSARIYQNSLKENIAPELNVTRNKVSSVNIPEDHVKGIDGRLCKVKNPAQFQASSFNTHSLTPSSILPSRSNAASQGMKNNTPICFSSVTVVEDVNELTDQMNSLSPDSYNSDQILMDGTSMFCHQCSGTILPGQVVVLAERAGSEFVWHPKCFVCHICQELLVDLVYFFHKEDVYCGRHYAEVLEIPRCFACDELIFLKEYTVAEGQSFHVKHFCCFECDIPLAGMKYVPKEDHPICLSCYDIKYGKKCQSCQKVIGAGDSRLGWKDFNWHATPECFKCYQCTKCLLGGQFVVKNNDPLCSKECVQQYKILHNV